MKPLQPSPDHEKEQHPANHPSLGYSGHLLTTPAIRLNTWWCQVQVQKASHLIWPGLASGGTRGRLSTHVPDEVDSPGPIVGHQD